MHGLELQTAVDEVEPRRAFHVHGRAQLTLGEALCFTQVAGGHCPVREGDLHVQRHGDDVGDEHEGDTEGPGGDAAPD